LPQDAYGYAAANNYYVTSAEHTGGNEIWIWYQNINNIELLKNILEDMDPLRITV